MKRALAALALAFAPPAFAAPVELGTMESAAARIRRRSALPLREVWATSCKAWSLVYACTVVM